MPELSDNAARHRYEMTIDGEIAYVTYARYGARVKLIHTEVPQALGGRGVGSALARAVLDHARSLGVRVISECAFIAGFITRHPEFADLVAT
jgi:hypothetical protein